MHKTSITLHERNSWQITWLQNCPHFFSWVMEVYGKMWFLYLWKFVRNTTVWSLCMLMPKRGCCQVWKRCLCMYKYDVCLYNTLAIFGCIIDPICRREKAMDCVCITCHGNVQWYLYSTIITMDFAQYRETNPSELLDNGQKHALLANGWGFSFVKQIELGQYQIWDGLLEHGVWAILILMLCSYLTFQFS